MDSFTPDFAVKDYSWMEVWERFWPLVRPHRWRWMFAAFLVSCVGLAVAVTPLFPKFIIDKAIPQHSLKLALVAAGIFLSAMFLRMVLWYIGMRQVYLVQQQIVFELRTRSFMHLQHLCQRFHSQYPTGFLYERVFGNSINSLGNFMQMVFQQLAVYVSGLIFSLGFCLYLSPPLTLIIILGAIGYVVAARSLSRGIYAKTRESNEAGMRVVEIIMDKLRGHKTIQAFAMEEIVEEEFQFQLWPVMVKWMDAIRESMRLGFVTEGLSYIINTTVVVGGAWLIMDSPEKKIGLLVAFMGYQATLIGMIQTLTNVYGQFMGAKSAFDQLYTVLDTHSTVPEIAGASLPAVVHGNLEFQNVSFAYDPGRPVINEFSVTIPPGQVVALIGRSGSGKTTLTSLLMRFYDPAHGSIRLDGTDIRDLPLRPYRSLFSVVLQDPYLFNTSIAANLRYIRKDLTEAEIIAVLEQAKAWEFVKQFPDTIYHRVGEGGTQLSGGQRQRLAIARSMIMPSRFVILDEATSALDNESESTVQQSMETLFSGRTVFIIAHRLATIRHASRILVMDNGRLVEDGTFEDLLAQGGVFHRLYTIATSTSTRRIKIKEAGFA
jgi:ABC-type multidrug transport system fused ATPase/permease subunit